jgi:polar amino acid transport system permease protein
MTATAEPVPVEHRESAQGRLVDRLADLPWWAIVMLLGGAVMVYLITTDTNYRQALAVLSQGVLTVVIVTPLAFALALILGIIAGLGRISRNRYVFNAATLYVQLMRGLPMAVWILYVALVGTPIAVEVVNWLGGVLSGVLGSVNFLTQFTIRDISPTARLVVALGVAYGAFEAETIRAGIESLGRGQMEAARSLGMSYVQAMRHIVLPQAIRRVLPTLGNDLVSLCKDTALGAFIAAPVILQYATIYAGASFQIFPTYNTAIFLYLCLTLLLSLFVKWLEGRYRQVGVAH